MKCPKCNGNIYYRGVLHTCSNCKHDIDHEDFENITERAEKAESELEKVKDELMYQGFQGRSNHPSEDVRSLCLDLTVIKGELSNKNTELFLIKSRLQGITVDKLKTLINACFIIDEYENGFTEIKINDIAVKEIHKLISEVAK